MPESIAVMAIVIAALFPLIDLGRPDTLARVFSLARFQSRPKRLGRFSKSFSHGTAKLTLLRGGDPSRGRLLPSVSSFYFETPCGPGTQTR